MNRLDKSRKRATGERQGRACASVCGVVLLSIYLSFYINLYALFSGGRRFVSVSKIPEEITVNSWQSSANVLSYSPIILA